MRRGYGVARSTAILSRQAAGAGDAHGVLDLEETHARARAGRARP
jgi:hypothetical protein